MNAYFWNAVLSVPDDEEAARMMDMLEIYEQHQGQVEEERRLREIEKMLEEIRWLLSY